VSVGAYLQLDDTALSAAIAGYTQAADPVLAGLASGLHERRLFKTLRLAPTADPLEAQRRLDEVLRAESIAPAYLGTIDCVHIDAYTDDEAIGVLRSGGRVQQLVDASPVLRGLSRERFVHHRAIFPPSVRARVAEALADLT
jgi:hypothetical protein